MPTVSTLPLLSPSPVVKQISLRSTVTTHLEDNGAKVIDAPTAWFLELWFAEDEFVVTNSADMVTLTGGQSAKDILYVDQSVTNTGGITMSGIEYLVVGNDTGASTVDLTNVTGLKDIALHDTGGAGAKITVTSLLLV